MARKALRPTIDPDACARDAFVLSAQYEPTEGHEHAHARAQLVHAAEGVIVVRTPSGQWVVPPQRAVWVPPGVSHSVASKKPFRLLTLYVAKGLVDLSEAPRVVSVDALVMELLGAAALFGSDYAAEGPEARLVRVILDRLPALAVAPLLHLPQPSSAELVRIAHALSESPDDRRTLDNWAALSKMTTRTAARRFLAETGMTFGQWRTQLRLHAALLRLGAGASVTAVAFEVGYEDVSSFIAAFKAAMGETPARYFAKRG